MNNTDKDDIGTMFLALVFFLAGLGAGMIIGHADSKESKPAEFSISFSSKPSECP